MVRDQIPVGRDFPPVQTGPGAHPASCKMVTGSFPGVKCGRGVQLTTHPLLVPQSWKSRAIPLPTLWATPGLWRDHFTFTYYKNVLPVDSGVWWCAACQKMVRRVRKCSCDVRDDDQTSQLSTSLSNVNTAWVQELIVGHWSITL